MIIPRSPSPVPLEERDVDSLDPEEMRELLRRQRVRHINLFQGIYADSLQERDAAARAVKQERGIKRERTQERSSTCTGDADDDEVSIVSTKRRREQYKTTVNEDGVKEIDLT